LKIGDKFFTIAYTQNTRIIEVEVIGTEDIDGEKMIHIQNIEDCYDKWFIPETVLRQWKFATKEEAGKILSEYL